MHGIIMSLQNRLQAILGREYGHGMPWNKLPDVHRFGRINLRSDINNAIVLSGQTLKNDNMKKIGKMCENLIQ